MTIDRPTPFPLPERSEAFRAAAQHSGRVRVLRFVILAGCLAVIAGLAAYAALDPFAKTPRNISIAGAGLNGTRVTMQLPKLSGYRADGRPYDLRAASGVQDIKQPNVIELSDIEARFDTPDKTTVHVIAPSGVYDSKADFITLSGAVRITSNTGYEIHMTSAEMNLKGGTVVSNEPVNVTTSSGTIRADRLDIADNGNRIGFIGRVETIMAVPPSVSQIAVEARP